MKFDVKLFIFDLDGTLIDSKQDLICAVNATRGHMGLTPLDGATIATYVGHGAPVLIRRAMGAGASDENVAAALEYFLAYYREHPLDYTTLYPGVREALEDLWGRGASLSVLTNKPVRLSRVILDGLGIGQLFFQVYGGNSFPEKKPHPVGIDTLRSESGASAEMTLMVGDSAVDVQTARNAGVRACGVTYGFQPESLAADPPDLLIDRMDQLCGVIRTIS